MNKTLTKSMPVIALLLGVFLVFWLFKFVISSIQTAKKLPYSVEYVIKIDNKLNSDLVDCKFYITRINDPMNLDDKFVTVVRCPASSTTVYESTGKLNSQTTTLDPNPTLPSK